jgi:NADPH:quinone reductase-like Zn-dependent oxidoreductase
MIRRTKPMQAVALTEFDTPPTVTDLPEPTPAANEVLVRVHASSANPVDNGIAAGMLKQMGVEYDLPVILGRDYSGVVEQVGADVTRYSVGDKVFGFFLHANPTVHEGSWAELITVAEHATIARVPDSVDLATAGAAPLAGIAAMLSVDALDLSKGDAVLIVGATGGVGSIAVQLVVRAGATVVAPALPEDEDYLRDLGVSEVLPRDSDLADAAHENHPDGFDAVLDLVNYAPGVPASLVKDGGRVASPTGAAGEGPGRTMVMAAPTAENFERLGNLLSDGLRVPIQATYELSQAPDALAALGTTHTRGKLAIHVR